MAILSLPRKVRRWLAGLCQDSPRPRPTFRPRLESLEDRVLPATTGTFEWIGAQGQQSQNWTTQADWKLINGNGTYPGAAGSVEDTAIFDDGSNNSTCVLNVTLVSPLAALTLKTGFAQNLSITNGQSLTVQAPAGTSSFVMQAGNLVLSGGAALKLDGGSSNWSGGNFNSADGGNGTVYVYDSASFLFTADASSLGASLVIGQDSQKNDSAGRVLFATLNTDLNNNVTLHNDASITVAPKGTLQFEQGSNSDTKGGIAVADGSKSTITNNGTINVENRDGKALKITPAVTAAAATSSLYVSKTAAVNFVNKYTMSGGAFKMDPGGKIGGFTASGGKMTFLDPGAAGSYDSYFTTELIVSNTTIAFEQDTPDAFTTVHIAGVLQMTGGDLSIPTGDVVSASDAFQESGGATAEVNGKLTTASTATLTGSTLTLGGGFPPVNGVLVATSLSVDQDSILSGDGTITADVTNAGEVDVGDYGSLIIVGNYTQTAGVTNLPYSGTLNVQGQLLEQGGGINMTGDLNSGANLVVTAGLQIGSAALLAGSGTITADVTNAGQVQVSGINWNNAGVLNIVSDTADGISGNYTQTGTASLLMGISGSNEGDLFNIAGIATLAGALDVIWLDNPAADPGEIFTLIYGSFSGLFDSVSLPTFDGGYFVAQYGPPFSLLAEQS